ncbi:lipopolysaccharide heptosyltransferase II [Noviherbaspirillum humi]|uniref:Lipopolysaccharide heptosyltransferase II n=1 Tax=Noviherbaspirillum humi TaxID=1688639 RepID=A0A239J378_9BURK|nr:glycosyltransferase family 9 protein [Noviherbaspirillum humi]SNS99104.1 lipopolysaccharide heptosyltransferase II [Noviherbaspirillum humi]
MNERWRQARNILCVRLDYLGDVLMCTPALRALRESLPGSRITLLTSGSGAAAAPYIPEVDDVLAYAAPWMKNSAVHGAEADVAFIEDLRARRFDAAVIFTTYSQSTLPAAMLCHLAGIPLRLAHCRENPYQMLTDWVPETEPEQRVRHEVRRQLDLVATIGCRTTDERLSFRVPPEDRETARTLLAAGIDFDKPWVLMHPGATAASRRYPVRHWQAVLRQLADDAGWQVALTGGGSEAGLIEEIRAGHPHAYSLAGKLSLGQLGAAIALAPVLVSNNTGPAHLAAAVGTPVVDLYALTNPQHTPWQVASRVLYQDVSCRFCYKSVCPQGHHACLEQVPPEAVVRAALELAEGNRHGETDEAPLRLFEQAAGLTTREALLVPEAAPARTIGLVRVS